MISVEIEGMEKALADLRRYSQETAAAVTKELNTTAQAVRSQAIHNAPINQKTGRGGQLKRLITADPVRNFETYVRSRAKYSEFVEFGTGHYGKNPEGNHTKKKRWIYFDEFEGRFVWAYPQRPRPFMHPAAESNRSDHIRRMKAALKPK